MDRTSSLQSQPDVKDQGSRPLLVAIEDNPTDIFLIREALAAQELDLDLRTFQDGEEAIRWVEALDNELSPTCPTLILLDINLPKTDGFEVLRRLRQSRECAQVPVIIMTSSAAPSDREKSKALGASGYFQKPSQYDAFLKIGEIVRSYF